MIAMEHLPHAGNMNLAATAGEAGENNIPLPYLMTLVNNPLLASAATAPPHRLCYPTTRVHNATARRRPLPTAVHARPPRRPPYLGTCEPLVRSAYSLY